VCAFSQCYVLKTVVKVAELKLDVDELDALDIVICYVRDELSLCILCSLLVVVFNSMQQVASDAAV